MRQTIFLIQAHNKQTNKQYYSYTHTHSKQTHKQYYSYTHTANKQTSNITHTRHTKAESMKKKSPFLGNYKPANWPKDGHEKVYREVTLQKIHYTNITEQCCI